MSTAAVLQQLQDASDDASRARAIRLLKNQLIGNRHKKVEYLERGAVPLVVSAASQPASADVLVQGAAALASIAYRHRPAACGVHACDGVALLVALLGHEDERVVEHSARALHAICEVRLNPAAALAARPFAHPSRRLQHRRVARTTCAYCRRGDS